MESTERDAPSSVRARHAAARVAPEKGPGRLHIMSRGGAPPASATTEAGITRSHPEPGS